MPPHPGFAPPPLQHSRSRLSARGRELLGLTPFVGVSLLLLVATLIVGAIVGHGSGFGHLLLSTATNATAAALFACALALTLHARSIDLSIIGTASLCGLVFASIGGVPGVVVALLVALAAGVVNAALVGVLGLHSVATTLGIGVIMVVIVLAKAHGGAVLLKHALPGALVIVVLVLLVLAAVALDLFYLLVPGRQGMPKFLRRSVVHLAAAGLAGLGGVVQVIVVHTSVANTGMWILMFAFAAAFLGGTSASGHGRSLVGAVLAAAFLSALSLDVALVGLNVYVGYALVGVVLVLALGGDRLRTFLLTPKASTPARPAGPAQ